MWLYFEFLHCRDISFLYDVPHEHTALPKVAPHDASGIRAEVGKEGKTEKEVWVIAIYSFYVFIIK